MIVWLAAEPALEPSPDDGLTSAALVGASSLPVVRVATHELSGALVERHDGATWVLESFHDVAAQPASLAAFERVVATQRFVRIEFAYDWCRMRSPVAHRTWLGGACDCLARGPLAPLHAAMHARAHHVFYMSARQRAIHARALGRRMAASTSVLGPCFSTAEMDALRALGARPHGAEWVIAAPRDEAYDHLKGVMSAAQLARDLGFPLRVMAADGETPWETIAAGAGLIYLPNDADPAPRDVVAARLMNRRVILNANVLHAGERWFRRRSPAEIAEHVVTRPAWFWQTTLS